MYQWEYDQLIKAVANSERRYAEILSLITLISEVRACPENSEKEPLWARLKETVERHNNE